MEKWICIYLLSVLLACQPVAKPDDLPRDEWRLNQQLDEIVALCPDFNLDKYLSFFETDAVIFPPSGPPVKGVEAIRKYLSGFNEVFVPSFSCEYSDRNFEIRDSLAVRTYRSYGKIPYLHSNDTLISDNKYLDVLKKQPDGSWKIIRQIWNAN